jgi:DNA polymerase elongation subunit (family B)
MTTVLNDVLAALHDGIKFAAGVREMFNDVYGESTAHNLHSSGRILLNIWRAMQTELKLPIYNLEACLAAVLRMRVPDIPAYVLSGAVSDAYCLCMHAMVICTAQNLCTCMVLRMA